MSGDRPKILLLGAEGQLGRELAAALPACGTTIACGRRSLDITDSASVARAIGDVAPAFIVNAAAYTAVDRAEQERDAAYAVNATAPGILANAACEIGAVLIHYSTDYVFDGEQTTPYDEEATPHPLNVYGASKLAGERAIAASGAPALTLRTSWVYSRHGQNFLTTMERLAGQRDELRIVADQQGTPNWTRAIARATVSLIQRGSAELARHAGLYHLTAAGSTTWYDFARSILRNSKVRLVPITTAEYPTPARRPRYGVLDQSKFARVFGFSLPDWKISLCECMDVPTEPSTGFPVN